MVRMTIDADKVDTYPADDRGRVNLGAEYANKDIEIVIVGPKETDERDDG